MKPFYISLICDQLIDQATLNGIKEQKRAKGKRKTYKYVNIIENMNLL